MPTCRVLCVVGCRHKSKLDNVMQDKYGQSVEVGDVVRVLEIAPEFLALLDSDERQRVSAMLNDEYVVDDLPEPNKASVSISWEDGEGQYAFSGLYMLQHEFELVRKRSSS